MVETFSRITPKCTLKAIGIYSHVLVPDVTKNLDKLVLFSDFKFHFVVHATRESPYLGKSVKKTKVNRKIAIWRDVVLIPPKLHC